jgi:hypothetical protein
MILLFYRMAAAMPVQVALLHIMMLNYFVQYLVSPTLGLFYPSDIGMSIPPYRYAEYIRFALPACVVMYLCMVVSSRLPSRPFSRYDLTQNRPAWSYYVKFFFVIGVIFKIVNHYLLTKQGFGSVGFIIVLASSLMYVGLFSIILLNDKHWVWYALIVLLMDIRFALEATMFHSLLLWGASLYLVIVYKLNLKWRSLFILVAAFIMIIWLQTVKLSYRYLSYYETTTVKKVRLLADLMINSNHLTSNRNVNITITNTIQRFNQGWIVSRVMLTVPDNEPYANGSTIFRGIYNAVIPRILDREKAIAGGREYMERFANTKLTKNTSMNIGILGEMYANFGKWGGIIACGVYMLLIGLLYKVIQRKSWEHPVWWAWAPFVGHITLKAEDGFMETLNWMSKSMLVMLLIVYVCSLLRSSPVKRLKPAAVANSDE